MSDSANYWLGRMIATLKQTMRESLVFHYTAATELRAWAESDLCSEAEANEINDFLEKEKQNHDELVSALTAGGIR